MSKYIRLMDDIKLNADDFGIKLNEMKPFSRIYNM